MLKVGLLVGRERSFPDALINEVNSRNAGVVAEYVKVGEVSSSARMRLSSHSRPHLARSSLLPALSESCDAFGHSRYQQPVLAAGRR